MKSSIGVLDIIFIYIQESLKKEISFSQNSFTARSTFTKWIADVNQRLIFVLPHYNRRCYMCPPAHPNCCSSTTQGRSFPKSLTTAVFPPPLTAQPSAAACSGSTPAPRHGEAEPGSARLPVAEPSRLTFSGSAGRWRRCLPLCRLGLFEGFLCVGNFKHFLILLTLPPLPLRLLRAPSSCSPASS